MMPEQYNRLFVETGAEFGKLAVVLFIRVVSAVQGPVCLEDEDAT